LTKGGNIAFPPFFMRYPVLRDFAAAARGAELRLGRGSSEVTPVRGRRVTGLVFGAGSRPMRP
jgi:hypothetical protein